MLNYSFIEQPAERVGGLFCLFAESYPKKMPFYTQTAQEYTENAQDICRVFAIFAAEKILAIMIGTIGAILGLAGTAASGIMSAVNNKKRERQAQAESARQIARAEALANEDPMARASNQKLMREYDRQAQRQVENARNVSAITGATPEYAVAVQEGVAQGRADMMSDIAAGADARRDKYLDQAEAARQSAAAAAEERALERNQTYANIAANAANAAGSLMQGIGSGKTAEAPANELQTFDGEKWQKQIQDNQKLLTSMGIYTPPSTLHIKGQ